MALGWLALIVLVGGSAVLVIWPGAAAQNIDHLRDIIGDTAVARLEELVLGLQDNARQVAYQAGWVKPSAPWSADPMPAAATQPTPSQAIPAPSIPAAVPAAAPANLSLGAPAPASTWYLASAPAMGSLAGEGKWSAYIQAGAGGDVVAARTFLQPDRRRPYSLVAVVAFDLAATRLHFVLGSVEPVSATSQPGRTGKIPAGDFQPGALLATFNGGFKARHGHFGAMADGITALPPISGLATIGLYDDGSVRMGIWGNDIVDSPHLLAWRQNGKPLVRNGQVNPATTDMTDMTIPWGMTVDWKSITWRSALGLSSDRRTLFYAAGPEVDVRMMASVMADAGADQAMELDVNTYWVSFSAIHADGAGLSAQPLLPTMARDADRYLKGYTRDFFYVTAANP